MRTALHNAYLRGRSVSKMPLRLIFVITTSTEVLHMREWDYLHSVPAPTCLYFPGATPAAPPGWGGPRRPRGVESQTRTLPSPGPPTVIKKHSSPALMRLSAMALFSPLLSPRCRRFASHNFAARSFGPFCCPCRPEVPLPSLSALCLTVCLGPL
jgi:hypothetical protein